MTYKLTVTKIGKGKVTGDPAGVGTAPGKKGIDCGSDCLESYANGTLVTLSATPAFDAVFTGWNGACTGTGTCQVTMNQARTVTATFSMVESPLEVFARSGDGALWHIRQTSAGSDQWSDWVSLGGWLDQLAVVPNADGRLEVFARSGDGALWHMHQMTACSEQWSNWMSLGGWIDLLVTPYGQ